MKTAIKDVKTYADGALKIKARKDDVYTITASTNAVDRDGDIVLPTSFKNITEYLGLNPVILWGHDAFMQRPIGKAVSGRIQEDRLDLDIRFAETDLGKEVKYLFDEGFLNSFSIGFIVKDYEIDKEGRRVITDSELVEVSAVSIPANKFAVMQRSANDKGMELKSLSRLYDEKVSPAVGEPEKRDRKSWSQIAGLLK